MIAGHTTKTHFFICVSLVIICVISSANIWTVNVFEIDRKTFRLIVQNLILIVCTIIGLHFGIFYNKS
jgi:NO-binding membrane sensor protein with MHYT domain